MLDWFTTIPGLLISCGVILLLIAVVLFILGNKKEKISNNLAMQTGVMNQPLINDEVMTKEPTSLVMDDAKVESFERVNPQNPSIVDFTPATPVVEENSVSENTEAYDFSIPTEESVVDTTNTVSENTSSYDFSIPVVEQVEEVKEPEVTIYGGNDPLENTQVVEEINHEPYGGFREVTITEPTVEPVVEQPKVEAMPTISIPEIQPLVDDNKEEL